MRWIFLLVKTCLILSLITTKFQRRYSVLKQLSLLFSHCNFPGSWILHIKKHDESKICDPYLHRPNPAMDLQRFSWIWLLDIDFWGRSYYLDIFRLHNLFLMIGRFFSLIRLPCAVLSSTQLTFAFRSTSRFSWEQESIWVRRRRRLSVPTSLYRAFKSSYSLLHFISSDSGS